MRYLPLCLLQLGLLTSATTWASNADMGALPADTTYSSHSNDAPKHGSAEALAMIRLAEPSFHSPPPSLDAEGRANVGLEQVYENEDIFFTLRDGKKMHADHYAHKGSTTIVLMHGSLASGFVSNRMAGLLREATDAEIYAIDLRGHGMSEGRPGDVDYIGQYADDLVDVLSQIQQQKPDNTLVVAGHSMGGGIAVNLAASGKDAAVDGYILFAPDLGPMSPTVPKKVPATIGGKEPPVKLHMARLIGLHMLNQEGIHRYNHLPVLFYNVPEGVPISRYSYRSVLSGSPADYRAGLTAMKQETLVIVGEKDEVFIAHEYTTAIAPFSGAEVVVVEGATHNGVRHSKEAMNAVNKWIRRHF